jgi:hypothetical protein
MKFLKFFSYYCGLGINVLQFSIFFKLFFLNLSQFLVIKFLDLDPELDADLDLTGAVGSDRCGYPPVLRIRDAVPL